MIDQIQKLCEMEHEAAALDILGTDRHAALRKTKSRPVVTELIAWAEAGRNEHRPTSPLTAALRYLTSARYV